MTLWQKIKHLWHKVGSPAYFYSFAGRHLNWISSLAILSYIVGLTWGLLFAPADYLQGNSFRIIYIHVPAAVLSMGLYVLMATAAGIGLIWRMKLAFMVARSCAGIGACFTLIALVTGSIWGKPTWGTWWLWDARLTSELVLLFLYLGYIGLNQALPERDTADKTSAILALVGVINIPVIHYSVIWWQSLHQGASLLKLGTPSIATEMLWPLLVMLFAFALLSITYILINTRTQILERRVKRH